MKDCHHQDKYEKKKLGKLGKVSKIIYPKLWELWKKNSVSLLEKHLELYDSIFSLNMKDHFITVKDHKDNYENNKLGKVSKVIGSKLWKL